MTKIEFSVLTKVLLTEKYELLLISSDFEDISTQPGVSIKWRDTALARTKNRHFYGYIYCF